MWERDEDRLALLELIDTGRLSRRESQTEAWQTLVSVAWTRRTGRHKEVALVTEHREALVELLDRVWPDWRLARTTLAARGLDPTPTGWRRLQDTLRSEDLGTLPDRLNVHTATSSVAPHSKATIGAGRRAALGRTTLTRDGIVRLRPHPGLRLRQGSETLDATAVATVLGEVALNERALLDGTVLEGLPRAVLLVENLGPYQDLRPPEGWMIVHVPGWDTATVRLFLGQLSTVPLLHFGDLDPNGVRIVWHLRTLRPDLRWAVPDFWREYVESRSLPVDWPDDLDLADAPRLVHDLAREGLWMEQEVVTLDERLTPVLAGMVDDDETTSR
jgi:hypothetical protein